MPEITFTVSHRVQKKVKNVTQLVFQKKHDKITDEKLKSVIAENIKKNILCFIVKNNKTGVEKEYKKTRNDKNYSVKILNK